jgi:hypothetical protein
LITLAAALVALGAAGCGGGGDDGDSGPSSPDDVAVAYWEAGAAGDGAGMCEVMSADLHGPGDDESCAETAAVLAEQRDLPDPEVTSSKTEGDKATVEITGSNDLTYITYLVNEDGEWKVDNAEPK